MQSRWDGAGQGTNSLRMNFTRNKEANFFLYCFSQRSISCRRRPVSRRHVVLAPDGSVT